MLQGGCWLEVMQNCRSELIREGWLAQAMLSMHGWLMKEVVSCGVALQDNLVAGALL